jgi:hypothetical protein
MHGWAPDVIGAVGVPDTSPQGYLQVFFTGTPASRRAGQQALQRMYARTEDRDETTTWAIREASTTRSASGASPATRCCNG